MLIKREKRTHRRENHKKTLVPRQVETGKTLKEQIDLVKLSWIGKNIRSNKS